MMGVVVVVLVLVLVIVSFSSICTLFFLFFLFAVFLMMKVFSISPSSLLLVERAASSFLLSELLTGLITQSTPRYIVSDIKLLQFSYKLPKGKSVYIRFRTDLNDEFRNKLQTGRPMVTVLLRLMHEIASLHAYNFTADNGIVKRKDFTNSSHSKKEDNKKKKQEEEESCYDIITQNFNTNLARFRDMRRYNKCLREFQGCIVNCHHNDVDSFLQANPNWVRITLYCMVL